MLTNESLDKTEGGAVWAVFWAAFLFAFPWSRTIQAVYFWNPHVGIDAKGQPFFLAVKPVLQSPPFTAGRRDFQIQPTLIDREQRRPAAIIVAWIVASISEKSPDVVLLLLPIKAADFSQSLGWGTCHYCRYRHYWQ